MNKNQGHSSKGAEGKYKKKDYIYMKKMNVKDFIFYMYISEKYILADSK